MKPASVAEAFAAGAARWRERPFLAVLDETAAAYGIAAGEWSYGDALARTGALRARYAAAGYTRGHRVGLLLANRPAFFLHWFALNGLGVSVVPISAELRTSELEYLIAHSEITLAVAPAERHAGLRQAAVATGRTLGLCHDDEEPPAAAFAPAPPARETGASGEADECALLYTSGTSGRPKGCLLSNRYFLHAGDWYAGIGGLATLRPGVERMLTPLPLTHMNAMAYSALAMVTTGGCLVLLDRFHPASWWASVRESRASVVHYLGLMPSLLMKAAPSPAERDHEVRFGFGAGVERSLHAAFEARFGFPLLEAWAMTETGAGAAVIANTEPRCTGTNCFGREEREVEVRLVAEGGRQAGVEEPGELQVRHRGDIPRDGFFTGYLKDEAATAEAWAEGWFHTGDIVRRDAGGRLHFVDRRKNIIRRSGENISAVEVESVLQEHPAVKACAVAATPDGLRGDEVLACIVCREPVPVPERAALAASLVEHALARLAYFKAPGYIAFVDALPLTASQKIQRGELKSLAAALPTRPGCIDLRSMKRRQG